MTWFSPTPREISTIEQLETALRDTSLNAASRDQLLRKLWKELEAAHGGRILSVVSPEGQVIQNPFFES
jgi:hypothetical protein